MFNSKVAKYYVWICVLSCVITFAAKAQETIVKGVVKDAESLETLPMVNVYFKNTTIGTISDTLGNFQLTSKIKADTLVVSFLGYQERIIPVRTGYSELHVVLTPDMVDLDEVKVKPSDQQVRALLKEMVNQKPRNNPEKHDRYSFERYTKWEYRLNNVKDKMMNSRVFKDHKSYFKTRKDGTRYLPVYLSEQLVSNEFQREPLKQKSTILADKTSGLGVLGEYEIGGYTSGLDIRVNFYNNYIKLLDQNFVSPAADNGWFYYKYYLEDSVQVGNNKHYKVLFVPRRKGDKVFRGHMYVENQHYSILEVDGVLASTSGMNFVKSLRLGCHYQFVDDSIPFYKRDEVEAIFDYLPIDVSAGKERLELYYSQVSSIDKVDLNPGADVKLSAKSIAFESIKLHGAYNRDTAYWNKVRHEPLSPNDKMIYSTIDSINNIPVVKVVDNLARMTMTGYYDVGKFELGPYVDYIQYNKIEGARLFLGGRTSKEISNRWMVWGGVGYGTRNEKFSGSLGGGYKFPGTKRNVLKLYHNDKYARMGENENILYLYENMLTSSENNLVSALFTRDELDELYRQKNVTLSFEKEWRTGLTTKLKGAFLKQYSPEFYPFLYQGKPVSSISDCELSLDFRFSWKEKVVDDEFMRLYVSSDYPIIHFNVGGGRVEWAGKDEYYTKIHSTLKHNVFFGQTQLKYALEGGMIFGQLPYTLLNIPRGNETWGYYSFDFNMLNYLEYVHDKYLHAYMEYHLNGFIFNRMPFLKRLGLREVVSAKGMIGDLSQKQYESIALPSAITPMNNPYAEVGVGLENLFRFFRVEGIWRVTPSSMVGAPEFGIRAKFEIKL